MPGKRPMVCAFSPRTPSANSHPSICQLSSKSETKGRGVGPRQLMMALLMPRRLGAKTSGGYPLVARRSCDASTKTDERTADLLGRRFLISTPSAAYEVPRVL